MATERISFISPEEYIEMERESSVKHEYFAGQIFSMAGGSPEHNEVGFNTTTAIGLQLRGSPCRGYTSDQRVLAGALFTYPDISIVCGDPRFHEQFKATLLNPVVIIEVLSESTEGYDRGGKFRSYQQIESLREYVLISQDQPRIERYLREPDGSWNYLAVDGSEGMIHLESISADLPLADVYANIDFERSTDDIDGTSA